MADGDAAPRIALRAPRSFRVMGVLGVVAGVGLIVAGPFTGELGMSAFGLGICVLGVMPLRMRVEATSGGLLLNHGLRTQHLEWHDIESFRVLAQRWSGNGPGLYALLSNGNMVQIPLPYGGGAVRSRRATANLAAVRDQLERVRLGCT